MERFDALPGMKSMPIELIRIISDYHGNIMSVRRVTWRVKECGSLEAEFRGPLALAYDGRSGRRRLICCDTYHHRLRQVRLSEPAHVSVIAPPEMKLNGHLVYPSALCVDPLDSSRFFVAVTHCIVSVVERHEATSREVIAGHCDGSAWGHVDGVGTDARFDCVGGMCCDSAGKIFVADYSNNAVRLVTRQGKRTVSFVTDTILTRVSHSRRRLNAVAIPTNERLHRPVAICVDPRQEHVVYILCLDSVQKFDCRTGVCTTAAPSPNDASIHHIHDAASMTAVCCGVGLRLYVAGQTSIFQVNPDTGLCIRLPEASATASSASLDVSVGSLRPAKVRALAAGEPGTLYCSTTDAILKINVLDLYDLPIPSQSQSQSHDSCT